MPVYQINGHWHYAFAINGTRYRKAIKEARTRRQAERAEQVARNEVFERRWGETGRRNFADFVEKVYKPHARNHKKGFEVERSVLKALVESLGNFSLGEITTEKVQQFQDLRAGEVTQRGTVRSKATVNRDVAVLSAIMKLAVRLGELRENPVSKVSWYSNLPKRDRVLSDEEEVRVLKGLQDNEDLRDKFEILLYTGLRRSELFRLEWRDIDFENGLIRLRPETTKTAKGRVIVMCSNVRRILERRAFAATTKAPTTIVFDGIKNRAAAFTLELSEACKNLGIENVSPHTLRHTYSTRANRFGVDPFAQKAALGHTKLSQTADYTHQSLETFRRNFEGFEQHLEKRNGTASSLL